MSTRKIGPSGMQNARNMRNVLEDNFAGIKARLRWSSAFWDTVKGRSAGYATDRPHGNSQLVELGLVYSSYARTASAISSILALPRCLADSAFSSAAISMRTWR